jgi:L-malate glycosyltransferase
MKRVATPLVVHLSGETGWRGGERQVWYLLRGLKAHRVPQVLVAPPGSPLATAADELGVHVHPLKPRAWLDPRNLTLLGRSLRTADRPVVLHAHTSRALDSARLVRRLAPVAAVVHTRRVSFRLRRARKYQRAADLYVGISRAIANDLVGAGTPLERIRVVPSGVDLKALDRATAAPSSFPGHEIIGCVAQMTEEKGVAVLADAWAAVLKSLPDARLVLIGDGAERLRIERIFAASGLRPTVHLAGFVNDVVAHLKTFDCYVQPSLHEGLGTTAIDALACRIPVVASRTGGLPEVVVDGTCGRLVAPGDAAGLAAAIIDVMTNAAERRRFGARGRKHVEAHFAVERMVDAYREIYRALAAGRTADTGL